MRTSAHGALLYLYVSDSGGGRQCLRGVVGGLGVPIPLYSIQIIIYATGLTGVVQTMFTTVLVILIVVADIYVFLGAVRSASKKGR